MKRLLSLWLLLSCCALFADWDQKFSPPRELNGDEYIGTVDNYRLDPDRGATLIFTGRYLPEGRTKYPAMTTLFYKRGEFLLGFRDRRLYFIPANAGDGTWNYSYFDAGIHAQEQILDQELHQFAVTLSRYTEPEQGIDRTDVKIYFDGALAAGRRYDHFAWKNVDGALVAGGVLPGDNTFDGKYWNFTGFVDSLRILDRALSDEEIKALVKADPRLKPNFPVPRQLTAEDRKLLTPSAGKGNEHPAPWYSAMTNTALAGRVADWQRLCLSDGGDAKVGVHTMPSADGQSVLTVVRGNDYATIASFYDCRARRELLAWDNPFFEVTCQTDGKEYIVSGMSGDVTRKLTIVPQADGNGGYRFAFSGECKPTEKFPFSFAYTMNCRFADNRLEYEVQVENRSGNARLAAVKFPALRLNSFKNNDTLLVPCMSGVEYKNASAIGAAYSETYPRGRMALQMAAYYDDRGGAMIATEDPRAQAKKTAFAVSCDVANFAFIWSVPYRNTAELNRFAPGCMASLTLFRGDWYDAGLAYRAMLERIKAPWWCAAIPNPECPRWFRDNAIWIGRWQNYRNYRLWLGELDALAKWKEYVGSPGQAVHFYEWCLHFTRDWPHNPASPDFVDRTRAMRRAGYRVVPYINGRIWEDKDKRDEDYRFSRVGKPAVVRMPNGRLQPEPYGTHMFYVICPATQTYENEMLRECDNCVIHGADGAYLDQIGAAPHHLCHSDAHGHLRGDPDTWYMQGHRKVFRKLRERWRKKYPDAITFGEDISEAVVGVLDGGLTWRWMCEGQVGLFPLVYSGRTQMAGLSWAGGRKAGSEDLAAVPAKLTFQLFNDCQLGWFGIAYLTQPGMKKYRKLVKQYAHLRTALLDFFNRGMMARPPRWEKAQVKVSRYWGNQGTRRVSTEPLQACAWRLDGVTVLLAANTGKERGENTLTTDIPACALHLFYSDGRREQRRHAGGRLEMPLVLNEMEFAAILAVPEGHDASAQLTKLAAAFEIIACANGEPDPFADK